MTMEAFDSELADFAEAIATTGLNLVGLDGKRLLVIAFPEDAYQKVRSAFVRASGDFQTSTTASTLWALLDPFLDDYERSDPESLPPDYDPSLDGPEPMDPPDGGTR